MFTLGAGAIAALLALGIEGFPVVWGEIFPPSTAPQLDASTLFPTPGPQHKTVDVYDPPPQQPEQEPRGGGTAGTNPAPESPEPVESPDN